MPTLRPYQSAAVEKCVSLIDRQPICCAPTGSGKTVMGVAIAQRIGGRVLWVAHRRELIHQAANAVREAGGYAGLVLAGEEPDPAAQFQVGSVQTIAARGIPDADMLVVDEAHHATSASYLDLVAKFPRRLGLTATPFRLDGKGLRSAGFNEIVVAAYTDDLCAGETLHEPTVYAAPAPDLRGVKKTAGDYNVGQLGDAMRGAGLDGRIVATWQKRAAGRRTVAFAVDIAHAYQIADAFKAVGVAAEVVTGTTPKAERAGTLARLSAGVTTIVVNVGVLTEGWDLPALEVAIIARPTASLCLHLQQIGRIMRSCEGKAGAIVLDHAGNFGRHGLVTERLTYSLDGKVKKKPGEAPSKCCPECAKVVPAGSMTCPECGYEFPRKDPTVESDVELLPVGHKDTFPQRAARWHSFLVAAIRIARWQDGQKGNLWDEGSAHRAHSIASAKFKARYGVYPLTVRGELIEVEKATAEQWALMRAEWMRVGQRKGWNGSKVSWFVRKCEADARGVAHSELVKANNPTQGTTCPVTMDDGTVCGRPRSMPHSICSSHKRRVTLKLPMGEPIRSFVWADESK